jgi:hypothetical protein
MKVVLKRTDTRDGCVIWSLTLGQTYEVIGIEGDYYRIINERDDPILFDPTCFDIADPSEPIFWESLVEDGVRYAYPPEWIRPGFFEDYHDNNEEVRRRFWQDHDRYFGPRTKE